MDKEKQWLETTITECTKHYKIEGRCQVLDATKHVVQSHSLLCWERVRWG